MNLISGLAVGDGQPFGARRDVAELAAEMGGDGRHVGRAEYNARADRLGGAIAVNLVDPAGQTGISHGPDVVFKVPVEPAAGQVSRALVVGFRRCGDWAGDLAGFSAGDPAPPPSRPAPPGSPASARPPGRRRDPSAGAPSIPARGRT